jgi:type IV secretory pathway VirB2 component (pilin)
MNNKFTLTFRQFRVLEQCFKLASALFLSCVSMSVFAATDGVMNFENLNNSLTNLTEALTGPVAVAICTIGIVVSAAGLIFGGELSDLMRRFIMVILAISIIAMATGLVGNVLSDDTAAALI